MVFPIHPNPASTMSAPGLWAKWPLILLYGINALPFTIKADPKPAIVPAKRDSGCAKTGAFSFNIS